jgi:non-ribosomal peptide synthetase component F
MAALDRMTARIGCVLLVIVTAGACGGGPSLTDYAAELETMVTTMNDRLDRIDEDLAGSEQTVPRIHGYAEDRIEARTTFLASLEALEPPTEAEDLHVAALDAIRSLVAAEQTLFEQAMASDDLEELTTLWNTPAGAAARAADEQAVAICRAAEAAINSTAERQAFAGMPWVPTELQEVVTVAFGCTAADR